MEQYCVDYAVEDQYTEVHPTVLNGVIDTYVRSGMGFAISFEAMKQIPYSCLPADESLQEIELSPAPNSLGKAIVSCSDTHVTFDACLLDALYTASASREMCGQDREVCGIIEVGFAVDSTDYDYDRYKE